VNRRANYKLGQAFDGTIGEAVRDAKANKLCFHKAGTYFENARQITYTSNHPRLRQC
jgi:hypothetical protein